MIQAVAFILGLVLVVLLLPGNFRLQGMVKVDDSVVVALGLVLLFYAAVRGSGPHQGLVVILGALAIIAVLVVLSFTTT